jgi:hypothetical protein
MHTKRGIARLEEVRREFEDWRRTRQRRTRIPEPLWRAAAEAAAVVGVYRTAKVLGINSGSLKKWVRTVATDSARVGGRRRAASAAAETAIATAWAPTGATFLELPPPAWAAGECTLELEEVGGAKMRVHLKGSAVPDLVALSRSFWEGAL